MGLRIEKGFLFEWMIFLVFFFFGRGGEGRWIGFFRYFGFGYGIRLWGLGLELDGKVVRDNLGSAKWGVGRFGFLVGISFNYNYG